MGQRQIVEQLLTLGMADEQVMCRDNGGIIPVWSMFPLVRQLFFLQGGIEIGQNTKKIPSFGSE